MKSNYIKLVLSTITVIKGSYLNDIWQFMVLFILSINFMLNLTSIWLILEHFHLTKEIAERLTINFSNDKYLSAVFNYFLYFFLPIFFVNIFIFIKTNKYNKLLEIYPQYRNRKLFFFHWTGSYIVAYICLMIVL